MRDRRIYLAILPWVLIAIAISCAVSQQKAPQLTPKTVWDLNVATQLQQLERDYRTVFTDIGDAQRQHILTDSQVMTLNGIGHRLKPAIEAANRAYKVYQANPTDAQRQVVIQLLTTAQSILLELSTRKSQILNGGGA